MWAPVCVGGSGRRGSGRQAAGRGAQVTSADRRSVPGRGTALADRWRGCSTAGARPGHGASLRENTAVLVEDGVIRRVADDRERCPDGARPVDLGQRVLMPGLTDAHTHASGRVPKTAEGAAEPLPEVQPSGVLQAELRDYLRSGVTTIRVCGSQGLMPQAGGQAMRYGAFAGPRLLTCGKIISATAPGSRVYGDMSPGRRTAPTTSAWEPGGAGRGLTTSR